MSILNTPLAEWTSADFAAFRNSTGPQGMAVLGTWSRTDAAAQAASLANTGGGIVVIEEAPSDAELASVAVDLGPEGSRLVEAGTVSVDGKRVGVLRIGESGAPPLVVETDGGIYRRTEAGLARILNREELDQLLEKGRLLRERAETNIEGMLGRVAFGHFNYMTIAVVAVPRFTSADLYQWAAKDHSSLVSAAGDFARRWGLDASHVHVSAGEIQIGLPKEITGFIRIARNGCVAAGQRLHRPAQDRFLAPQEFSIHLAEMAEAVAAPHAAVRTGEVVSAVFLEGVRDLRLPVDGGLTFPVTKDLVQEYLPERFLAQPDERAAFVRDVQAAVGAVFSADLVAGSGEAYAGSIREVSLQPRAWHGLTKRTERRLSGVRGHGST
jgi:hypothetical protein